MSYKPENDPTSPEAVKMCEQAADSCISAPKQFLLTLDVERDKLSTEDCDSVLEKFNFLGISIMKNFQKALTVALFPNLKTLATYSTR